MSDVRGIPADDVARAIHDVASPLTILVGLCFALRRRAHDPAMVADLGRIEGEVQRISDRLDALVRLAQHSPPRRHDTFGALSLTAVARDVACRASAVAERTGARVVMETGGDTLTVEGHPRALEVALENLVGNAVRHAGPGGTVWVATARWGSQAVLHVADDGPGVHPDDRAHIFDPHFRGRRAPGAGQGLGLAIARDTARAHGGDLLLEPSRCGAVFRLALPLAASAAIAGSDAA